MKNFYIRTYPVTTRFQHIIWLVAFLLGLPTAFVQAQSISGTVFRDFNANGTYESIPASGTYAYGEPGVGGIIVRAYNTSGVQAGSAVSGSTGAYSIVPAGSGPYRVEFTIPTALDYLNESAFTTSGTGTSVQFVASGTATLNFAVSKSSDYCQASPPLAVPCYVSGDPLSATTTIGGEVALVSVPYDTGTAVTGTYLATASDIGVVFGAAYQRETRKLFSAAFLKRHAGLGSAGLGGIYVTNMSTTPVSNAVYVDLESAPFSLSLGADLLAGRTLPGSGTVVSNDPLAFDAVGKVGLGGLALSTTGSTLYAVDLFNRQLLALAIGNPAKTTFSAGDLTQIAIPDPGCTNGVARPFAVKVYNGKVYVGVVCTGENGGTASDLFAHIYAMTEGSTTMPTTPVFSFRLNYKKGMVHTQDAALGSGWETWVNQFSGLNFGAVINPLATGTAGDPFYRRMARPQAMLSTIAFTDGGDMVIGFMDRAGHQLGYRQRNTTQTTSTTLSNGYIGGDVLRASFNGTNWVLENNGTVGGLSSLAGVGNGQGPGAPTSTTYTLPAGEFYSTENFRGFLSNTQPNVEIHQETYMGSSLILPGTDQMIATVMDPLNTWSGGFTWFSNQTGSDNRRAEIYRTIGGSDPNPTTLGKANGLGVIEALCAPAPIQIGNRVWNDLNNNGVQDPNEPPLSGVTVVLKGPGLPSAGVTVTTNSAGEYYFSNAIGTNTAGFVYSLTGLTSGGSYSLSFPTSLSGNALTLSVKPNAATGANADAIDTDANAAGVISFTLGRSGQNNFTYDAGYVPCSLSLTLSALPSVSICIGQSMTLSAQPTDASGSTPYSYTLLNSNTVNTSGLFPLTPTATTTYTVLVSNAASCTARATQTITVNARPTVALSSATICAGESVTLIASGGTLYNFGSGNTPMGMLVVDPAITTTYSVTVTNAVGCTAATSGIVTVNALPTPVLSSATICTGNSVTLAASGGTLYNFGSGNSATNTVVVSPTATTTYSVTVTNAQGCSAVGSGIVTVNALPVAVLSSETICRGESATLTASGGTLYNFGSGNQSVGTLVVSPASTTTYTVLVTSGQGCTAVGSGTVTVNALPTATLSNATICTGNTATLTASGGTLYDFGNGSQATNTLIVNPGTTAAYTVLVTNASACTAEATGIVTVNNLPVATLSSATICRGESATLTATGGILYNFGSGNSATGTLIVNPATTTTYTVLVTNAQGCTLAASGTVTVNPLPTATLSGATICNGQTANLTASGGNTGAPFSYTLLNTNAVNTTGIFVVGPTAATTYTVAVSNAAGCRATATTIVTVNTLPVATLSGASSAICEGQSTTLTASGGGVGGTFRYEFSGNINNTTGLLIVSPSATTTYSVVVTNAQNCTASASATITVNPVPVLDIVPANQVVCVGSSTSLTVANCTGTLRWSTGETTAVITITPIINTTYTVTCTTPEGCTTSARSEVFVSQPGSVSVTDNAPLCTGATLELAASGSGSVYTWKGPNGFTASTATVSVPNVAPANAGVYSVTISGGLCAGVGSTTVTLNPAVTASLSSASICEGEAVTLVASGGGAGTGPFTYEFTGSVNNTTGRFVVSPSVTASYSVVITNAQGCTGVASGTVTLHPAVTATLSSGTICVGGSATLTASGGTLYNFGSGNTTSTVIIVNPTITTTYNVTVTNAQGCTALATATVTVNPLPEPTLSSATICAGGSVRLTASGGSTAGPFSYTFSDGTINTTGTLSVTPATTTSYSVLVSNNAGCLASAIGTVTVNPLPVGSLSSATICLGESATLIASGGEFFDFASGVSPNNILVVEPTATTAYSVLITNSNRCSVSVSGTVTVNSLPQASLSSATICAGGSATLTASGGSSGESFSYTLLQTNEVNSTGRFVVRPTATTMFDVVVSNAQGCTATASNEVTVNTLPTAGLLSATICVGESATLTASGGALYNFGSGNTPDGGLIVNPTTNTTFSVVVTNGQGCTALATSTVVVNLLPIARLSSATICQGESATLLASVTGNQAGLLYDFGSGDQLSGILIVNPATTTTYSVVVTNAAGCSALANATLTVSPLPTVGITSVVCNGLLTYTVSFTATAGASVTASVGSVVGNQVVGIPSGQGVTLTATLAGCLATTQTSENCARNAASLGNFVWLDANANGQQDSGEPGLLGVVVTLVQNGSAIATTSTDASGFYSFTGLTPGIPYSVSFSTPTGYTATLANIGNDATDSDPVGGVTAPVTLTNSENNPTLDAGFNALYDVGIAKTVLSNGPYYPGSGLVTYQLTVTNNSIQPVYNVRVEDVLPAGVNFVNGAGFAASGPNTVSALIDGPVAASGTISLTLTVGIASSYVSASVVNNATITRFTATPDAAGPAPTDTNPDNNTATATVSVAPLGSIGNFVFSDTDRDGVQDGDETGIDNITVILYINGVASATTTTADGGLYSFTGLTPGSSFSYSVGFSTPANYSASPDNEGGNEATDSDAIGGLTGSVTLTAGENNSSLDAGFYPLRFDLALIKAVVSAPNPLLPGSLITYQLVLTNQGEITATNTQVTDTPPLGLSFNAAGSPGFISNGTSQSILVASLAPGQSATLTIAYTVVGSTSLALTNRAEITADSGPDLDSEPGNAPVNPNEDDSATATIQPVEFAALGNFVWEDTNANGQQDSGEPGLKNVTVSLVQNGSVVATTLTDAGGFYSFTGLTPGVAYQVQFGTPTGYSATVSDVGNDATDSDRDPLTGLSQSVTMAGGETNNTLDAGFFRPATLGDQVFVDTNRDGIQNNGEVGLGGVTVTIIGNGTVVATTTTKPDGTYSFTGLIPGVPYSVSFTTPTGYDPTTFPGGTTQSVTLASGQINNTLDAGFALPLQPLLNLDKVVSTAKARPGDVISYTVTLSNTGPVAATSVVVSDTYSAGLTLLPGSVLVSAGSFTPGLGGGTWAIASLPANATATMVFSASITEEGILYNTASIPGDVARVCTSVPFRVCPRSDYAIELTAPAGLNRYQWLYRAPGSATAVVVADGTLNSYTATQAGEYSMLADNGLTGLCAQPSCCPMFIEEVVIPEFVVMVRQPTCLGSQPRSNGQLTLTNLGADAGAIYDYQYSAGSSFSAINAVPVSASAVPADGVIATALGDGIYTVRITDRQTGCFRDVTTVPLLANCACPEEICVPVVIRKSKSLVR